MRRRRSRRRRFPGARRGAAGARRCRRRSHRGNRHSPLHVEAAPALRRRERHALQPRALRRCARSRSRTPDRAGRSVRVGLKTIRSRHAVAVDGRAALASSPLPDSADLDAAAALGLDRRDAKAREEQIVEGRRAKRRPGERAQLRGRDGPRSSCRDAGRVAAVAELSSWRSVGLRAECAPKPRRVAGDEPRCCAACSVPPKASARRLLVADARRASTSCWSAASTSAFCQVACSRSVTKRLVIVPPLVEVVDELRQLHASSSRCAPSAPR